MGGKYFCLECFKGFKGNNDCCGQHILGISYKARIPPLRAKNKEWIDFFGWEIIHKVKYTSDTNFIDRVEKALHKINAPQEMFDKIAIRRKQIKDKEDEIKKIIIAPELGGTYVKSVNAYYEGREQRVGMETLHRKANEVFQALPLFRGKENNVTKTPKYSIVVRWPTEMVLKPVDAMYHLTLHKLSYKASLGISTYIKHHSTKKQEIVRIKHICNLFTFETLSEARAFRAYFISVFSGIFLDNVDSIEEKEQVKKIYKEDLELALKLHPDLILL